MGQEFEHHHKLTRLNRATFPADRDELTKRHLNLLELRMKLLARNDRTVHRSTVILGAHVNGPIPSVAEGRSPIERDGVEHSRELFTFQIERIGARCLLLLNQLDAIGELPPPGKTFEF
jgi:hypothetical protein